MPAADEVRSSERVEPAAPGRKSFRELLGNLIHAIREADEKTVEEAVVQLSRRRKIFAPLAFAVGALVMLFGGVRLLFSNWRLTLVQALPAMWIWAITIDLKAHVLHGKSFHVIRGPIVIPVFAAAVLVTAASFFLNASFAFAISRSGPPDIRDGFQQARAHLRPILKWGIGVGLALGVAVVLAPRWGLHWFAILLGIVLAVMMLCYVAVPARIVGVQTLKSGRDKLTATAVSGAVGALVCAPPYLISRLGLVLLAGSFPLGVVLLVIGLTLEAGATGAVKAVKMSYKLQPGQQADSSDSPEAAAQPLDEGATS